MTTNSAEILSVQSTASQSGLEVSNQRTQIESREFELQAAEALVNPDVRAHELLDLGRFAVLHGQEGTNIIEPPERFKFNPDILEDYEEQVLMARRDAAYQATPTPSFEMMSKLAITPNFNPTGAPTDEIYGRNRVPERIRKQGIATHVEKSKTSAGPVEMWRIVDRSKLVDGSGLISSAILKANTLGDVEHSDPVKHLSSNHEGRMDEAGITTPFVSFSTDPQNLADMITRHGFGTNDGRDSVVVRVQVDPDRVLTAGMQKEQEVLLLGGVAPEEYREAYSVNDFVNTMSQ